MLLSQITNQPQQNDVIITHLTHDSRNVINGSLFFALCGGTLDGHNYVNDAIKNGAAAVVISKPMQLPVPSVVVPDTRAALSMFAASFYGNPANKLKLIGITGTNGKTTTTYILQSIFSAANIKCGIIGTNGIVFPDGEVQSSALTTPDPVELQSILYKMVQADAEYVAIEVSAHALAFNKIEGVMFDAAVFTNLSCDHLDFFKDMQRYKQAKEKFFTKTYAKHAIINVDDACGQEIAKNTQLSTTTYGCIAPSDVFALDFKQSSNGLEYLINCFDNVSNIKFNMAGRFNMYNTLCAAAIAHHFNVSIKNIVQGIKNVKRVDGRFNIINTATYTVIVDFAHTPDGLKNILTAIREFAHEKIITVFGCGGNRDATKRPQMGQIATELSDYTIITSDNPRFEDPQSIIADILLGVQPHSQFECIVNRKDAIKHALSVGKYGDIILIAGKGAEKTQIINGTEITHNDEEYIYTLLN